MPDENKDITNYNEEVLTINKFYASAFILTIVLILGMGMYFLANIDISYKNKLVPEEYEPLKAQREIPKKKGVIAPGADLAKVGFSNADLIAKGKDLFKTNCASCHGETGLGDGPGAAALNPKPRNYHIKEGWKNGRQISQIFKTLAEGIPASAMTAYEFLPVGDRINIIHYIMSLAPDFPAVTKEELAQMDAVYSISKGKITPNTIPASLAVTKLIEEAKPVEENIGKMITDFSGNTDAGAKLFNEYTGNKTRAITALLNNTNWKNSKENLFMMISYSVPENGWKRCILQLKPEQQNAIFTFLKSKI